MRINVIVLSILHKIQRWKLSASWFYFIFVSNSNKFKISFYLFVVNYLLIQRQLWFRLKNKKNLWLNISWIRIPDTLHFRVQISLSQISFWYQNNAAIHSTFPPSTIWGTSIEIEFRRIERFLSLLQSTRLRIGIK